MKLNLKIQYFQEKIQINNKNNLIIDDVLNYIKYLSNSITAFQKKYL
jgi:hypothetical protein